MGVGKDSSRMSVEIFSLAISEIRKHAQGATIALCKESASVWEAVGLELSRCACVCQLGEVDMVRA